MLSSVVILVVLAFAGAGLAAWSKSMIPAIGKPAVIGRWMAIALPAAAAAGFLLGYLQAYQVGDVAPAERQAQMAAGIQMMLMSLVGGSLGMSLLSGYLLVMVRVKATPEAP